MIQLEKYKAGRTEKGTGYNYFLPTNIHDQWQWNTPEINMLLEKAAVKLGELNSYAKMVPNINLFIQLHVTKEAVVSSRIEGTQTSMDEALMPEDEISPERRSDWKEVNNYIDALNTAIADLEKLPISYRILRKTHRILMTNVRGENKMPGEYRTSQNWIGGNSIADAVFIPPHQKYVDDLMGDLENFLHDDSIAVPLLVRIGIAHYQFETIHPFLDGNGRIGRLLITLFLVSNKILDKPLLYLSTYFEKNKSLYYDNLTRVRTKDDMQRWLKYFLSGVEQTSAQAVATLSEVLQLRTGLEERLQADFGRRSHTALVLMQQLFVQPVITIAKAQKITWLSKKAANDLVAIFTKEKILKEITGQTRNRVFIFDHYLNLFK
jgi:Fic family protein